MNSNSPHALQSAELCIWTDFRKVFMVKHLFLAMTLAASAFAFPGRPLAAPDVVIGYANISTRVSPLWIDHENGFFAKYGIQVQQIYMPGSPVMISSVPTGQVHLANSGATAALGAPAGGLDLRIIGTFTSHIPFDLVVRSNIYPIRQQRYRCPGKLPAATTRCGPKHFKGVVGRSCLCA
jgi:ABC-type nitrate/sulfonate/bicarbonate transport system substrate-binding protein